MKVAGFGHIICIFKTESTGPVKVCCSGDRESFKTEPQNYSEAALFYICK